MGPWKLRLKPTPKLPFYLPREPTLQSTRLLLLVSAALFSPAVCVRPRERLPSFRQHSAAVPLRLVQMLLLFRRSVASDSLRPRGLQPARPPCPSRSSLKLVSIESVMPSNHLILCRPEFFLLLADYNETL